jgi:hypothetical protein
MQQKFVEFHKLLEKISIALREFDDFSESANMDNFYNKFKMCNIVIKKETKCKSIVNLSSDKTNNNLFKCVWPQCRYSSKQKVNLNQHILIHSEAERFKCDFNG